VESGERSAESVMVRDFVSVGPEERLDLVDDVMKLGRVRHLPVLDDGRLVGIVSQRDVLAASLSKALAHEPREGRDFMRSVLVSEVMTRSPLSVTPDVPISHVARLMVEEKIGCVIVTDGNARAVGLVTDTDLLETLYSAAG